MVRNGDFGSMGSACFQLKGYRLLGELASGASGTVYRALQEELGRVVAVKMLAAGLFDEAETLARFVREAKLQARLSHPSLLGLFDAGVQAGHPYLVVEYVEGGSLRDRLARPLSPFEAVRIGESIARGLAHAHAAGIVHRDLKPENVLLTADGQVKVADFGLAKVVTGSQTFQSASGLVLGTPGYLAPEVMEGRPATAAADLYALGVILFEMLAGRGPFEAEDLAGLLVAQSRGTVVRLEDLVPSVLPSLATLVHCCLEREPGNRPASASEVAETAGTILRWLDETASTGGERPLETQSPASRRETTIRTREDPARTHRPRAVESRDQATLLVSPGRPPANGQFTSNLVAAARSFPSRIAVALLLVLAVTLTALLTAEFVRPRVGGGLASGKTAAVPRAIEPEALPELQAVGPCTVGADRIRLWFANPVPAGARLIVGRGGLAEHDRLVPGGLSHLELAGLASGSRYTGRLILGGWERTFDLGTLRRIPGVNGVAFDFPDAIESSLVARSRGKTVALAWRRRFGAGDQLVMFRSSPDEGETWGPIEMLSRRGDSADRPSLAVTDAGLHLAWGYDTGPGRARTQRALYLMRREGAAAAAVKAHVPGIPPASGEGWEPPVDLPGGLWPSPALTTLDGKTVDLDLTRFGPVTAGTNRRGTVRMRLSSDQPVPRGDGWAPLPEGLCLRNWLAPTSVCRRELSLVWTGQRRELWSRRSPPIPGGGWSSWRLLTAGRDDISDEMDVVAGADRIVVAYADARRIRIHSLQDGQAESGSAVAPLAAPSVPNEPGAILPALAFDGRMFYLACVKDSDDPLISVIRPDSIAILASRDGVVWTAHAHRSLSQLFGEPRSLALCLSGERLLAFLSTRNNGIVVFSAPKDGT